MISARPIISADAVAAVLLGFRIAFSRASVPAVPPILVPGQPSSEASGRTARLAFSETPMKRISVPNPRARRRLAVVRPPPKIPKTSTRIPRASVTSEATGPKRDRRATGSAAPSRTAAIGGTRVALIAGRRLASRVTMIPTNRLTTIVRVARTVSPFGNSTPMPTKSAFRPFASHQPEEEADHRGDRTNDERLQQDGAQHLPARTADRPERCELPHSLRDGDRERVRDHERADEESDRTEGEQELLHHSERGMNVGDVRCGLRCRGLHLRRSRQQRPDLADELLGCDPVLRRHLNAVVLADLREQPLGGGNVEDRDRGGTDRRAVGVLGDARDLELACALIGCDANRVADAEVLCVRGVLVNRDLAAADGPLSRDELQRGEPRVVRRIDARADAAAAACRDHFAVMAQQLRLVPDLSGSRGDIGKLLHLREHGCRERRDHTFAGVAVVVLEGDLAGDHGIRVRERVVDDVRERCGDRVGEHVRAADHRDAQDDRQRGK